MIKQNALIEILTEELPQASLKRLSDNLQQAIEQALNNQRLAFDHTKSYATPRRLAIIIYDLAAKQSDQTIKKHGPTTHLAFDTSGKPSQTGLGFAKSCGVSIDQLTTVDDGKQKRLLYCYKQTGLAVTNILPNIIYNALIELPVKKTMRWGNGEFRFVRPIHNILMLYGSNALSAKLFGLETNQLTFGHRFCAPQAITMTDADQYVDKLKEAFVIASFAERRQLIIEQIESLAKSVSARPMMPDWLIDEVTSMVEWPCALLGQFSETFLTLPKEVLISVMQNHQKYIVLEEEQSNNLRPYFITISNNTHDASDCIIKGNERVIKARLDDGVFFYNKDCCKSLNERINSLQNILFKAHLGSLFDKTQRLIPLSAMVANMLKADVSLTKRAALLAKTDLATDMVNEFPELQGIMGSYYGKHDRENDQVASAIKEHYLPRYADDCLGETRVGWALAIADRIDNLVGLFGINQPPNGDKDPYSLRRATVGILRLILEKQLTIDLQELVEQSKNLYTDKLINHNVVFDVMQFIDERHRHFCLRTGYNPDIFAAVYATKPSDLIDFHARLEAVQYFCTLPEASNLAIANKRVKNILQKQQIIQDQPAPTNKEASVPSWLLTLEQLDKLSLDHDAEQQLLKELKAIARQNTADSPKALNYQDRLYQLTTLYQPINEFFSQVMVISEDLETRKKRLSLLLALRKLFLQIADISLLQNSLAPS